MYFFSCDLSCFLVSWFNVYCNLFQLWLE